MNEMDHYLNFQNKLDLHNLHQDHISDVQYIHLRN